MLRTAPGTEWVLSMLIRSAGYGVIEVLALVSLISWFQGFHISAMDLEQDTQPLLALLLSTTRWEY